MLKVKALPTHIRITTGLGLPQRGAHLSRRYLKFNSHKVSFFNRHPFSTTFSAPLQMYSSMQKLRRYALGIELDENGDPIYNETREG